MNWSTIWDSVVNFFKNNIWNIALFFLILFGGLIIIKILMNITKRILNKTKIEKIAQQFICTILKFILYLGYLIK